MAQIIDTWRIEAEMQCGQEVFRNFMDVKYEPAGGGTTPPDVADVICQQYFDFLVSIFYPDVSLIAGFVRGIYYKEGPPPRPEHPPLSSAVYARPGTGNVTFGGAHNANFLPADVSIFVKKGTSGGRSGKNFIRNILTEVDVVSTLAGTWAFSNGAGHFDQAVFQAQVTTFLVPFFTANAHAGNHSFAVTHLEGIPDSDPRTPFSTYMTSYSAIRPAWNRAKR